jgi:hypothetical protein
MDQNLMLSIKVEFEIKKDISQETFLLYENYSKSR